MGHNVYFAFTVCGVLFLLLSLWGMRELIMGVVPPSLKNAIAVGSFMFRGIARIDWDDVVEALPAFITILIIPLTFSITEGIAFEFIACSALRTVRGRWQSVHRTLARPMSYACVRAAGAT